MNFWVNVSKLFIFASFITLNSICYLKHSGKSHHFNENFIYSNSNIDTIFLPRKNIWSLISNSWRISSKYCFSKFISERFVFISTRRLSTFFAKKFFQLAFFFRLSLLSRNFSLFPLCIDCTQSSPCSFFVIRNR